MCFQLNIIIANTEHLPQTTKQFHWRQFRETTGLILMSNFGKFQQIIAFISNIYLTFRTKTVFIC